MKNHFLANERIYLRAIEPEDIDIMYKMENDPDLWDISNFSTPYSRYTLRQYIESSQSDMFADKQLRLMIIRRSDECVLGTLDLTDFAPLHSRAGIGIALGKNFRHKGYASDAVRLLCNYAFGFLRIHQLYAHVAIDNTDCLTLFDTCGFTKCGILKDWIMAEGKYKDAVLLQRIHC